MLPKSIQKSWHFYLSKIKKHSSPDLDLSSTTFSSSKGWIFRDSKHPKTPFSMNNIKKSTTTEDKVVSATMADDFLVDNFNSLYLHANVNEKGIDGKGKHVGDEENDMNDNEENSGFVMFESPRFLNLPPKRDGPQTRFFINQTSSSSLIEEARASMASSTIPLSSSHESKRKNNQENAKHRKTNPGPEDFTTMLTSSMNPYDDFRRSMVEMIEERLKLKGKIDYEFMEGLLFWYLNLNDEKSYKFIVSAFVDLMVAMRGKLVDSVPVKSRNNVVRSRRKNNSNNVGV